MAKRKLEQYSQSWFESTVFVSHDDLKSIISQMCQFSIEMHDYAPRICALADTTYLEEREGSKSHEVAFQNAINDQFKLFSEIDRHLEYLLFQKTWYYDETLPPYDIPQSTFETLQLYITDIRELIVALIYYDAKFFYEAEELGTILFDAAQTEIHRQVSDVLYEISPDLREIRYISDNQLTEEAAQIRRIMGVNFGVNHFQHILDWNTDVAELRQKFEALKLETSQLIDLS